MCTGIFIEVRLSKMSGIGKFLRKMNEPVAGQGVW
jgi:hypothetical protein